MTQTVTAFTLVDITETGVQRVRDSNSLEYHQQQNLNVLLQTCGLRTQVIDPIVVQHNRAELSRLQFHDFFGVGEHEIWSVRFMIETPDVWLDGDDPIALLKQDVHGVAITPDLDNTVEFPVNVFDTLDNVNTYFIIS